MKCKECGAELDKGVTTCPECGHDNAPERRINWTTVVCVVASVVLLAALAVVLLTRFNVFSGKGEATDPGVATNPTGATEPFEPKVDYTGSQEEALAASADVVATMNGMELTNGMLQIYYYQQLNDFLSSNYMYLSQIGMDLSKPLNQQRSYYDPEKSWEEFFIETAITSWQKYMAVYMLASESGFTMSAEAHAMLDDELANLASEADKEKLDGPDALIKARISPNCSYEDYALYSKIFYTCMDFTSASPADEDVETYFNENAALFEQNGITKESGAIVDVRHILISPEGGTKSEDGKTTTYSDKEWADCLAKAEAILQEWKDAEATEESFAQLANKNSTDPGSNTNGGLYTGITEKSSLVEPFLNWCMDKTRKVGDTGIVKTDYGYHIMYFSATQEQWFYYATVQLKAERTSKQIEEAVEKWPMTTDYEKLCLAEIAS